MKNIEERQVEWWKELENTWKLWKKDKLNSEMISKTRKKSKLKSEKIGKYRGNVSWIVKIGKIWKKPKLNSEKIWKIQKKIVKRIGKYRRKVSWIVKWYGKYWRK
jgi:hypothetical protein